MLTSCTLCKWRAPGPSLGKVCEAYCGSAVAWDGEGGVCTVHGGVWVERGMARQRRGWSTFLRAHFYPLNAHACKQVHCIPWSPVCSQAHYPFTRIAMHTADNAHHQLWAKAIFCCCFLGSLPATLFHFMMKPFVFILAFLHFSWEKYLNSTLEIQYSTIFRHVTTMKS